MEIVLNLQHQHRFLLSGPRSILQLLLPLHRLFQAAEQVQVQDPLRAVPRLASVQPQLIKVVQQHQKMVVGILNLIHRGIARVVMFWGEDYLEAPPLVVRVMILV